ncbi:dapper homolog 3 [Denticeps clupeoides]|uniref:Dapper homolog 3-like n=1 Tax=Denticeps clupeoides TaxID=299321 RepID=A0AAY4EBF0_9TELE|nr:dapper homolog 3-like [Denticeps clupeoides]
MDPRGPSTPMAPGRSRNKEHLEESVSWLCDLELLKQRQESLVLGALCLGDVTPGPRSTVGSGPSREQEDLTLRRQLNRLRGAPQGLMVALEQQLHKLSFEPDKDCEEQSEDDGSRPSSGFYEQSDILSPPGHSFLPPSWAFINHRPLSLDASMMTGETVRVPSPRATLPRSFSAPYPPLEDIAEGTGEDEEEEEPWPEPPDLEPSEEDIEQALRVEAYILSLLQRRVMQAAVEHNPVSMPHHNPHGILTSRQFEQPTEQKDYQALAGNCAQDDLENSKRELAQALEQYYTPLLYHEPIPASVSAEENDDAQTLSSYGAEELHSSTSDPPLIKARYIPAYCSYPCSPTLLQLGPSDQHWTPLSPNKPPARPSIQMSQGPEHCCWGSGEMSGRSTSRSQSDSSLRGGSLGRYYTVQREVRVRIPPPEGALPQSRCWCSASDLTQEEGLPLGTSHHAKPWQPHTRYLPKEREQRVGVPAEGSDSSLSEAYSPGSSSLTSDSDESAGGLVWPQQLPPRLATASPPPSSSIMKIKASHALKKKIMRFRSGSLKVMTTV